MLSGPVSEITSGGPQFAVQHPGHSYTGRLQASALCVIICRTWTVCSACHCLCHHLESMALLVICGVWLYLQNIRLLGEARTACVLCPVRVSVSRVWWSHRAQLPGPSAC